MGSNNPSSLKKVAPMDEVVTDYDRAHFQHYVQLLDARSAGINGDVMCRTISNIDPDLDPDGAQQTLQSHLDRAIWMARIGFRQI